MSALPPVRELVPHKSTMLLLGEALAADETGARAALRVAEDSLLYDPALGGIPAWAGLEYMAQTVALYAGAQARKAGQAPAVGFLLGTRRFEAHVPCYKLAARIEIEVRQEFRDDQMAVFDCWIREAEALLAEARLSVFQPHDAAAFLERGRQ